MRNLMLAGAFAGFLIAAPAGAAVTTFATYTQISADATLHNEKSGATGGSLYTVATPNAVTPGSVGVSFNFLNAGLVAAGLSNLSATFTMNLSQSGYAATQAGSFVVQDGYTGSFSFIYSGLSPLVVGGQTFTTGANLLSGTIGSARGAVIGGSGTSGNLTSSTGPGRTVTFTSDFLDFTNVVANDLSLSLTSITPSLAAGAGQSLNSFHASSTGSFSSDPAPVPVVSVPEPATWGMMILGFGVVGAGLRRRRIAIAA